MEKHHAINAAKPHRINKQLFILIKIKTISKSRLFQAPNPGEYTQGLLTGNQSLS
jgi:hypothetical protein